MSNSNKIEEIGIIIDQMSQDIEALKEDQKINPARWEELIMASESIRCKINSLYLEQIEIALTDLKRSIKDPLLREEPRVPLFVDKSEISHIEAGVESSCVELPEASVVEIEVPEITPEEEEEEEFELFYDPGESILDMTRGKGPEWMIDNPGPKISDINEGITLNDKLLFINELFNGDAQQYRLSLQRINDMFSVDEVLDYTRNAFPDWDEDSNAAYRFYMNVRRKVNG